MSLEIQKRLSEVLTDAGFSLVSSEESSDNKSVLRETWAHKASDDTVSTFKISNFNFKAYDLLMAELPYIGKRAWGTNLGNKNDASFTVSPNIQR